MKKGKEPDWVREDEEGLARAIHETVAKMPTAAQAAAHSRQVEDQASQESTQDLVRQLKGRPSRQVSARLGDSAHPPRLGRWGRLFLASLRKNDPAQHAELAASGELQRVAASMDRTASAEYEQTFQALLTKERPATNFADRQSQVRRLQRQAAEIVRATVIVPTPEWARQQAEGYTDEKTAMWSEKPLLPKPTAPPTPTSRPAT